MTKRTKTWLWAGMLAASVCLSAAIGTYGQDKTTTTASADADEIPIEKCDVLPVVRVKIGGSEMRFLLDTGATTILNLHSFASGGSKEIQVSSWSGTAATSAREVRL